MRDQFKRALGISESRELTAAILMVPVARTPIAPSVVVKPSSATIRRKPVSSARSIFTCNRRFLGALCVASMLHSGSKGLRTTESRRPELRVKPVAAQRGTCGYAYGCLRESAASPALQQGNLRSSFGLISVPDATCEQPPQKTPSLGGTSPSFPPARDPSRREHGHAVHQHHVAAHAEAWCRAAQFDGLVCGCGLGHQCCTGEHARAMQFDDCAVYSGGQAEVICVDNEAAHRPSVSTGGAFEPRSNFAHKLAGMMEKGRPGRLSGRLAQLVRAPALQAGSRGFESLTAHHAFAVLLRA